MIVVVEDAVPMTLEGGAELLYWLHAASPPPRVNRLEMLLRFLARGVSPGVGEELPPTSIPATPLKSWHELPKSPKEIARIVNFNDPNLV